jgi:hypothetical protein
VAQARENDGSAQFVAIPRGATMLVFGNLQSFGLVDVECEGQRLAVFRRDIEERAEKVEDSLTPEG